MIKTLNLSLLPFFFVAAAFGQQPFVNGAPSSDGSSLCLAAPQFSPANAVTPVIVNDCISGHPSQMFSLGSDSRIHFGASNSPYCLNPAGANNPMVLLNSCSGLKVNIAGGAHMYMDSSTTNYCMTIARNAQGSPVTLVLCPGNSPVTFRWSNTIAARWVSLNMNPNALFDANGCLVDLQGKPMTAVGCLLVAVRAGQLYGPPGSAVSFQGKTATVKNLPGNGGGLISQDGSGIVASGAGNIILNGGGNLQIAKKDLTPVTDKLISQDGAGIVASGAGNIVASGAGNVVGTVGHYSVLSVPVGLTASGRGDSSILNAFFASLPATAASDNYQLTQVNASSQKCPTPQEIASGVLCWPSVGQQTMVWLHSGTAVAPHAISFWLQLSNGQYQQLSSSSVSVAPDPGRVALNTNLVVNTSGTLVAKDEKTGKFVSGPRILVAGAASPFQLTSVTANPSLWTIGPAYTITWQATGTATSNETISLLYKTSPTVTLRLASGIPANQGHYNYSVGSRSLVPSNGQLIIHDDLTNLQVGGTMIQIH
jgi:hypothetical protein